VDNLLESADAVVEQGGDPTSVQAFAARLEEFDGLAKIAREKLGQRITLLYHHDPKRVAIYDQALPELTTLGELIEDWRTSEIQTAIGYLVTPSAAD
jgi:hypothetical protein